KQLREALLAHWPDADPQALGVAARCKLPLVQITPRGLWGRSGQVTLTTAEHWLGRPAEPAPEPPDATALPYLAAFGPASLRHPGAAPLPARVRQPAAVPRRPHPGRARRALGQHVAGQHRLPRASRRRLPRRGVAAGRTRPDRRAVRPARPGPARGGRGGGAAHAGGDAPRHGVRRPLRDRTGVTPRGEGALRAARGSPQRPLVCTPGGPPGPCGGYVLICAVTCAENVVSRA